MIYYLAEKTTLHASFHNCVEVFVSHEWNLSWWKFDLFSFVYVLYKTKVIGSTFILVILSHINIIIIVRLIQMNYILRFFKKIYYLYRISYNNETDNGLCLKDKKESWHFYWFIGCKAHYSLHVVESTHLF